MKEQIERFEMICSAWNDSVINGKKYTDTFPKEDKAFSAFMEVFRAAKNANNLTAETLKAAAGVEDALYHTMCHGMNFEIIQRVETTVSGKFSIQDYVMKYRPDDAEFMKKGGTLMFN